MIFDPKAYAVNLLAEFRAALAELMGGVGDAYHAALVASNAWEIAVADTLTGIVAATDPAAKAELEGSLAHVLPGCTSAILSELVSAVSTKVQALLEALLAAAEKAALIALKSFSPIPL